jgi:hypothetical protein
MTGDGLDTNGNWHDDPGNTSGTDPYVYLQSADSNFTTCAEAVWQNGSINNAVDPMFFTTYQCGPN